VTPPSVRFLGRRVYLGVVVVLVSAFENGPNAARVDFLRRHLGGSLCRETLLRWRKWWREAFPATRFWTEARARFSPPVALGDLPASLLARFDGADLCTRVLLFLAFVAPLSTSSAGARAR
jgi:hypothetical protein